MIIDRAASVRDKFLRPEKKRPGQEIRILRKVSEKAH